MQPGPGRGFGGEGSAVEGQPTSEDTQRLRAMPQTRTAHLTAPWICADGFRRVPLAPVREGVHLNDRHTVTSSQPTCSARACAAPVSRAPAGAAGGLPLGPWAAPLLWAALAVLPGVGDSSVMGRSTAEESRRGLMW